MFFTLYLSPLFPCPVCGGDRRVDHVSQSVSGWQFYNTCTTLMGAITHVTIALHTEIKRRESERVGEDYRNWSKGRWVKITVVCLTYSEREKKANFISFIYESFFSRFSYGFELRGRFSPLCCRNGITVVFVFRWPEKSLFHSAGRYKF